MWDEKQKGIITSTSELIIRGYAKAYPKGREDLSISKIETFTNFQIKKEIKEKKKFYTAFFKKILWLTRIKPCVFWFKVEENGAADATDREGSEKRLSLFWHTQLTWEEQHSPMGLHLQRLQSARLRTCYLSLCGGRWAPWHIISAALGSSWAANCPWKPGNIDTS